MKKPTHGLSLLELLIVITVLTLILMAITDIYSAGLLRWATVATQGRATQDSTSLFGMLSKDIRIALNMQQETVSGRPVFTLTLPDNTDGQGNYVPAISGHTLAYQNGARVRYYLSDITGAVNANGNILWRAEAPSGSSNFTPDASWSRVTSTQGRFDHIDSFLMSWDTSASGIWVSVTGRSLESNKTTSYTRRWFFGVDNHNLGPITVQLNPCATFLRTNGDPNAVDASAIDLQAYDIQPGDRIVIVVTGLYGTTALSGETSWQTIGVFSTSNTLQPGNNLNRVSGAVAPAFDANIVSYSSPATQHGHQATDITQDFVVNPYAPVTVPTNARYLFLCAPDSFYSDNTDSNNDYFIQIFRRP